MASAPSYPTIEASAWHDDGLARGYSRRQLGRIGALLGAGLAASRLGLVGEAQAQQAAKAMVGAVRLGSNECWAGPFPAGADAAMRVLAQCNRYEPENDHDKLFAAVSAAEGVPAEAIMAWPGSSDPLSRAAVTFGSPTRGIVAADATYEVIWATGAWAGAKVSKAPLTPAYAHDVRAMAAADPEAGLFYICTPNNPTGTITPLADIEWLLANKKPDAVVLIDEAYIHWCEAPSAIRLAAKRDDVIVMRTFSKLFGMAGMRLGLTIASPKLHEKMMRYDGRQVSNMLPMTAVACGTASLPLASEIKARRAAMIAAREETAAWLVKRGLGVIPGSQANMLVVDWKGRSTKDMMAKLLAQNVQIGRSWEALPGMSRVTVGSAEEMATFRAAVDKALV